MLTARRQPTLTLEPLATFYAAAGRALPACRWLEPGSIPQPFRGLLVHERDMTGTLAEFHGGPIGLRVLEHVLSAGHLRRRVVLLRPQGGGPAAYGASHTRLDALAPAVIAQISAGRCPLGEVLKRGGVEFLSRPSAFFHLRADAPIAEALELREPCGLFGRCNTLSWPDGRALATVVEVLPPIATRRDAPRWRDDA